MNMILKEEPKARHINSTLSLYIILITVWLTAAAFLMWMISRGSVFWLKSAAAILLAAFVFLLMFTSIGFIAFLGLLHRKDKPNRFARLAYSQVIWLYPILTGLGKVVGVGKDEIRKSYTQLNNQVMRMSGQRYNAPEILILTPHCLQQTECTIKITNDIAQCRKCGKCTVGDLYRIRQQYGVDTVVVTGGTLARRRIKEKNPKMIIAIACERDLVSGLMDVKNVPVYAIINDRPEGPCKNTRVDIRNVEDILSRFVEERLTI